MHVTDSEKKLEILKKQTSLDLSLNDLRIIVGCFRAVAYQAKRDDEPYLDPDALELKSRLEALYSKLLNEKGKNGNSRRRVLRQRPFVHI
jgi:hypothetical protein